MLGVIAVSATHWNYEDSYEKNYIVDKLKFKIHDSLIPPSFNPQDDLPSIALGDLFKRRP